MYLVHALQKRLCDESAKRIDPQPAQAGCYKKMLAIFKFSACKRVTLRHNPSNCSQNRSILCDNSLCTMHYGKSF